AMSVALVAVVYGVPAYSQSPEGRISGVVRDASGAVTPGATLTVTNQATNVIKTVTSAADGSYAVSVAPGLYSVTVSLKGFGRQTHKDLKLEAGAALTADLNLQTQGEEKIPVTAMKREQTVHDVPFSVAAPTEELLADRGVDSIEGVAAN